MTIQEIQDNQKEVIEVICEYRSDVESVKEVLDYMAKNVKYADCEMVSTFTLICLSELGFDRPSNDKGSLAQLMASAHEDERYDLLKKEWVKI